jgi:hypothetical protein
MDELKSHRHPKARKYAVVLSACVVAFASNPLWQEPLSEYLQVSLKLDAGIVDASLAAMLCCWIAAALFCAARSHRLRAISHNGRPWRETKQKLKEDAARAEAYLGIGNR